MRFLLLPSLYRTSDESASPICSEGVFVLRVIVRHRGDLHKTRNFLTKAQQAQYQTILEHYGQRGVEALAAATPRDTGLTAASWGYQVEVGRNGRASVSFTNSNVVRGVPIAIILQYGHGTRNGGYVQGRDYINPAVQPIFDEMANTLWKEVTGK